MDTFGLRFCASRRRDKRRDNNQSERLPSGVAKGIAHRDYWFRGVTPLPVIVHRASYLDEGFVKRVWPAYGAPFITPRPLSRCRVLRRLLSEICKRNQANDLITEIARSISRSFVAIPIDARTAPTAVSRPRHSANFSTLNPSASARSRHCAV